MLRQFRSPLRFPPRPNPPSTTFFPHQHIQPGQGLNRTLDVLITQGGGKEVVLNGDEGSLLASQVTVRCGNSHPITGVDPEGLLPVYRSRLRGRNGQCKDWDDLQGSHRSPPWGDGEAEVEATIQGRTEVGQNKRQRNFLPVVPPTNDPNASSNEQPSRG